MDNRIPPVIKDFVKQDKPEEIKGYNYLAHVDWIDKNEHLATDWMVVAKTNKTAGDQDYYTISCFAAPQTDETKKYYLQEALGK